MTPARAQRLLDLMPDVFEFEPAPEGLTEAEEQEVKRVWSQTTARTFRATVERIAAGEFGQDSSSYRPAPYANPIRLIPGYNDGTLSSGGPNARHFE